LEFISDCLLLVYDTFG